VARRRFTVDEFERMAEAGILGEDDPVEPVDGEVVERVPIGPPHDGRVNRLLQLLCPSGCGAGDRGSPERTWRCCARERTGTPVVTPSPSMSSCSSRWRRAARRSTGS
jgi:hypothetical protein